jgi:hypothetical protein
VSFRQLIAGDAKTFIPSEQWPDVQAALRGETPVSQPTSPAVDGVRMVAIDEPRHFVAGSKPL